MSQSFFINSIGVVRKTDDGARIEIFDEYADGLLGLEGFSHMMVFYWFDQNDTPENRKTLQVHPRKDPRNPLTDQDVEKKFDSLAGPVLSESTRQQVKDTVWNLDKLDSVSTLMGLLKAN